MRNVRAEVLFVRLRGGCPCLVWEGAGVLGGGTFEARDLVVSIRSRMDACPDCTTRLRFCSCAS